MPVVVKLGGSLLSSPELGPLLQVASRHGAIVAPGGGAFADAVRRAQCARPFSDKAAHLMAILAMEQTAVLLGDLAPALAPCASPGAFAAAAMKGTPAVWRPAAMAFSAALPASWDVTSDSLALWLAIALAAPRLILLKSAATPANGAWTQPGLVDGHFPTLAKDFAGEIVAVGPATADALDAALASPLRSAA